MPRRSCFGVPAAAPALSSSMQLGIRRGDRLCEGQAVFTGCELSFKNASTACTRRLSLIDARASDQQPEDDADSRRGQNRAREQASQSQCHRCDGRPDPSSGNQPQWRPSAAGPGHDQVFQPTVDRRAEAAGHRARIRLGFLNGDDATPRPLSRASGDRSEPARPPLPSGRSGATQPQAYCRSSSNSAASGRSNRCAKTVPLPRSRSLTLRSSSSSGAAVSDQRRAALARHEGGGLDAVGRGRT